MANQMATMQGCCCDTVVSFCGEDAPDQTGSTANLQISWGDLGCGPGGVRTNQVVPMPTACMQWDFTGDLAWVVSGQWQYNYPTDPYGKVGCYPAGSGAYITSYIVYVACLEDGFKISVVFSGRAPSGDVQTIAEETFSGAGPIVGSSYSLTVLTDILGCNPTSVQVSFSL